MTSFHQTWFRSNTDATYFFLSYILSSFEYLNPKCYFPASLTILQLNFINMRDVILLSQQLQGPLSVVI